MVTGKIREKQPEISHRGKTRKPRKKPANGGVHLERPPLEANRNYSVQEAALAVCVHVMSIWRAIDNGHLKCNRIGRRVIVSGQQLIDWIARGARIGSWRKRAA